MDRKVSPKLAMTHVTHDLDASLLGISLMQDVCTRGGVAVAQLNNVLYNRARVGRTLSRTSRFKLLQPRIVTHRFRREKRSADDREVPGRN